MRHGHLPVWSAVPLVLLVSAVAASPLTTAAQPARKSTGLITKRPVGKVDRMFVFCVCAPKKTQEKVVTAAMGIPTPLQMAEETTNAFSYGHN